VEKEEYEIVEDGVEVKNAMFLIQLANLLTLELTAFRPMSN
jgi:hypothetical protein